MVATSPVAAQRKRHPVRGFLGGLVLGLGLTLVLVSHSLVIFGAATPLVVVLVCVVAGLAIGLVGPERAPKA